jgi:DUF1707 SHOCT-like domain
MTAGPGDGMPTGPEGRSRLRASDSDRERVVEALKAAFVQSRLTKDEFDLRVGQALASRILAELAALTADIPAGDTPAGLIGAQRRRMPDRAQARAPMSRLARSGAWVVIAVATLGLLAGSAFAMLSPPMFVSSVQVLLPTSQSQFIGTQVVIARSDPVLAQVGQNMNPPQSPQELRTRVQAKSLASNIVSVSAQSSTAAQAQALAYDVAGAYIAYLNTQIIPGGLRPRMLGGSDTRDRDAAG